MQARPVALVLLLTLGCDGGPERLTPPADVPTLGKARAGRFPVSSLVVSTETWFDPNPGSGDDGAVVRPTGYTLYDDQGLRLRYVRNYIGALDREPSVIELEPGRYLVLLDKPGKHPSVFRVVVEPGKITEVDLK